MLCPNTNDGQGYESNILPATAWKNNHSTNKGM